LVLALAAFLLFLFGSPAAGAAPLVSLFGSAAPASGAEAAFVYFDPQGTLKIREEALEDWGNDPEAVRIIQKMGDYLLVEVVHEAEEMSRDDLIWCAIPR